MGPSDVVSFGIWMLKIYIPPNEVVICQNPRSVVIRDQDKWGIKIEEKVQKQASPWDKMWKIQTNSQSGQILLGDNPFFVDPQRILSMSSNKF